MPTHQEYIGSKPGVLSNRVLQEVLTLSLKWPYKVEKVLR